MQRQCGVEVNVIGMIKRITLQWFEQLEQTENERPTKTAYVNYVEGRRRGGRPRVRW